MSHTTFHSKNDTAVTFKKIDISSAAFNENEMIPRRYTCDGKNVNPALNFDHIPSGTHTLAIIVDDPDAPGGNWVHWAIWNIPVTHHLKEDHAPGIQGINDFKKNEYGGPCPPSGTHRYFFKVYALDCLLDIPKNSNKQILEKAMAGHILGFGELIGLYKRE
jgi:Raf kinase inhibitor-like YbhB/YbcL family protein